MTPFQQWRLNAPEDYRWTNQEVLYEKNQSFANGWIVGALLNSLILIIIIWVL